MRILVISDSHGNIDRVKQAISQAQPFDMLLHCGDLECEAEVLEELVSCPCYMVRGNCDYRATLAPTQIIDVPQHKIYLTHGHLQGVHYDTDELEDEAFHAGCDIAIFGHTHRPYLENENGITILNPGSIALPRQDSHEKTYAVIEIDDAGELHIRHEILGKK